jgi:hypothetical protein
MRGKDEQQLGVFSYGSPEQRIPHDHPLRQLRMSPRNDTNRRSAVDERTTRHVGYQLSQKKRKRIEEVFGWMKSIGLLRKLRHRGLERVEWMFTFTAAAYNLLRTRNLMRSAPPPQCA